MRNAISLWAYLDYMKIKEKYDEVFNYLRKKRNGLFPLLSQKEELESVG